MTEQFGQGDYVYVADPDWGRLPDGWSFVDASGVAVDSRDRVYVFSRGTHPMVVFDREGTLLDSWGDGIFTNPHGLQIGPDDSLYCVDNGDHTVRKFAPDGTLLMTLGTVGVPSDTGYDGNLDTIRGGPPFNRPTNAALSPDGDLYVTDGYGNCKVHRFAPDGALRASLGSAGTGPGQFRLVHGIIVGPDGTVYVGDRQNNRVQIFSPDGEYLGQWGGRRPEELRIGPDGEIYVAELGHLDEDVPNRGLGARITIRDAQGTILSAWGDAGDPCAAGNLAAPHGLAIDSRGDLYVAEVTYTARIRRGLVPPTCHVFQKFVRVRRSA